MISHEATILKAAVLCLLIPPNHKFLYNSYWKKLLEQEQENCFQDFETLLLKKVNNYLLSFYYRASFTEDVHVVMINAQLIPLIKPNRQGKKQNEAQLLLSLV